MLVMKLNEVIAFFAWRTHMKFLPNSIGASPVSAAKEVMVFVNVLVT